MKWELLIMLSGPEPQRSILDRKILGQLSGMNSPVLVLRGLPGEQSLPEVASPVHIVNHLSQDALNEALCASGLVIARAGYTSIMELMSLGKKCILVPTPGQPEQEWLATYLAGKKLAVVVDQDEFVLSSVLAKVKSFPFASFHPSGDGALRNAVDELMEVMGRRPPAINH